MTYFMKSYMKMYFIGIYLKKFLYKKQNWNNTKCDSISIFKINFVYKALQHVNKQGNSVERHTEQFP